jgi:hypothetical protein
MTPKLLLLLFGLVLAMKSTVLLGQQSQPVNGGVDQKRAAERNALLSRRVRDYGRLDYGESVDKREANAFGEIDLTAGMLLDYPNPGHLSAPPSLELLLSNLGKRSVLVIACSSLSYQSAFTPGRSFLYSVWEFKVDEVFKNSSHQSVAVGGNVYVIRTGGRLFWNNKIVVAHDTAFPDFLVNERYILFLQAIPGEIGAYRAVDWASYRLQDGAIVPLIDPKNDVDAIPADVSKMSTQELIDLLRRCVR